MPTSKPLSMRLTRIGSARGMLRPLLVTVAAHWYSLSLKVFTSTSLRIW